MSGQDPAFAYGRRIFDEARRSAIMKYTMQSEPARVTVFIAAYNAERFIGETIESVLGQTFSAFELLIIDDHSTDSTCKIVESYVDPRIRLERNDRNRGQPYTRNRGLEVARGEYIAVLDADDVCEAERLERTVAYLDNNPNVVAVGTSANVIDDNGRLLFIAKFPTDGALIRNTLFKVNCFIHSSLLFRRSVVRSIGGYNESLPQSQDYDLLLRLSGVGQLANINEPLVRYRVHRGQISQRKLRAQRRLADAARASAYTTQRASGLFDSEVDPPDFSLIGRLRGQEGSLGADYLYWAGVNRALGQYGTSLKLIAKALLVAPLCTRAWRSARWAIHNFLVPPRTKGILVWYMVRIKSVIYNHNKI